MLCACLNQNRRALLLVLLCNLGTLHVKKVTELLHKQQHTRREMGEAEENRRILLSRTYEARQIMKLQGTKKQGQVQGVGLLG